MLDDCRIPRSLDLGSIPYRTRAHEVFVLYLQDISRALHVKHTPITLQVPVLSSSTASTSFGQFGDDGMTGALDLDFSRCGFEEPTRMVQRKEMFTSCKYPSRAIYAVLITLAVNNAQRDLVQGACVARRQAQEYWYGDSAHVLSISG